jgi:hypothetical protein
MEIEGHPTQDIVDELTRRGAQQLPGASSGPNVDSLRFLNEVGERGGFWLFLPAEAFMTGVDDPIA